VSDPKLSVVRVGARIERKDGVDLDEFRDSELPPEELEDIRHAHAGWLEAIAHLFADLDDGSRITDDGQGTIRLAQTVKGVTGRAESTPSSIQTRENLLVEWELRDELFSSTPDIRWASLLPALRLQGISAKADELDELPFAVEHETPSP
jgi:hypothetical protein